MARDRWNDSKSGGGQDRGYPEMRQTGGYSDSRGGNSDSRSVGGYNGRNSPHASSYNDRRTRQFDDDRNDRRTRQVEDDRTPTPLSQRGGRGGGIGQTPPPSYRSGSAGGGNRDFGGSDSGGDFYDKMDGVNRDIERIQQNLRELERLHNQLVNAVSSHEVNRYQGQIDEIQEESNRLLDRSKTTLKRLVASTKEIAQTDKNEARLRQNKQSNAAKKLLDVADEYQKLQQWSKQKYRQRMEREIRIAKPDATPEEIERALEGSGGGGAFMQALMNDSRVQNARRTLRDMESRQDELSRIERSIEELFTLFQDMQMMIETQQEMINTIEVQVEATAVNLTEASKEMTKAVEHKRSSRKMAWIICGIVTVVVLIVLVVVFIQFILPIINAAKSGGGGGGNASATASATASPTGTAVVGAAGGVTSRTTTTTVAGPTTSAGANVVGTATTTVSRAATATTLR
ncbi:t-SNARE [Cladochytrium replicatum]|nr:t-SNARE [Cladochytrium replicatum]